MRAFARPEIDYVVGLMASQIGKTECQFNVLGWMWDGRSVPAIYLCPTEKLARTLARDRLPKMIASVPALTDATDKRYSKPGALEQWINGVRFGMAWAGSATEVASHPCGMVHVDERSRMDDIPGEGDPVRLASARTKNYPGSKVGIWSSPTEEGLCPTYRWWLMGSKQRWCWQCPGCGEWYPPTLEFARYPEKAELEDIKREAWMECPTCEHAVRDEDRAGLEQGYVTYLATPEGELEQAPPDLEVRNPVASYWVTGFSSEVTGIGEVMYHYALAARGGDPGEVRAAVNTYAGELFKLPGQSVPADAVRERRTDAIGDVQLVTVGVDVQQDSLYYRVRGWGPGTTSWGIQHGQLHGSTEFDDVWLLLAQTLDHTFCGRRPDRVLIDSGYQTAQVYSVCLRHSWLPSKGYDHAKRSYHATNVDVSPSGRVLKRLKLWNFCADTWKQWLYSRIQWPEDQPGAWFVEADADDEYCAQVVNERWRVTRGKREWYTTGSRHNHFLDCEVLCAVAAHSLNVRALRSREPAKPKPKAPEGRRPAASRGASSFQRQTL